MFFVRDKSNIIIFGITENFISQKPSEVFDYMASTPTEQSIQSSKLQNLSKFDQ